MKNVVNLNQFKKCQLKKISKDFSSRNFSFERFPQSLLSKKELSPGELLFAQDQLDKIVYYLEEESYKSSPSDEVRVDLEYQKDLYVRAIVKSQKVIPLK